MFSSLTIQEVLSAGSFRKALALKSQLSYADYIALQEPHFEPSEAPTITVDQFTTAAKASLLDAMGISPDSPAIEVFPQVLAFSNELQAIANEYASIFSGPSDEFTKQFGMLSVILDVCKVANTTFEVVMQWPVRRLFYLTLFLIAKSDHDNK